MEVSGSPHGGTIGVSTTTGGAKVDWRTLVCASCGHPVVEGGCRVCRDLRSEFQRPRPGLDVIIGLMALVVLVTLLVTLLQR